MSHQPVGGYKEQSATDTSAPQHPGHSILQRHQPQAANGSAISQQSHQQQKKAQAQAQQHAQQHGGRPQLPQHPQQQQQQQQQQQGHPAYSPHPPPHQSAFQSSPGVAGPQPGQQQQQHAQQQVPQQVQQQQPGQQQQPAQGQPQQQQQQPAQQPEIPYFAHQSPYGTPATASTTYPPPAEGADLMATHTMNRPTYPPIYHTTQSNSPASVASPPGGDHRSVYQQQPMQTPMYGYQQYQQPAAPPPPYMSQQHPQHMQNQQPMLMSHAQNQTMTPPQQHHHQQVAPSPSAAPKMPQQHQQAPVHKASPGTAPPSSGSNKTSSINPNAAPGPIPATTPLVVRQDQNGVQWIMFEYSRDRIKMEYTIRCDVASVNVDALSPEFKTENCVYPRACCSKDQYRGNRLVYETECNSVGWALAELNPPLRGKRGLIQRAVDSWRNSNQDPRLRSRRVRRMAKLNNRKATAQASQAHLGAGSPGVQALPSSSVQTGLLKGPSNLMPTAGQQLHHHHTATADNSGAATNGDDEMGAMLQGHQHSQQPAYGNVQSHLTSGDNSRSTSGHLSPAVGGDEFGNAHAHAHHHHQPGPTSGDDIRPRHVFNNGYPTSYPSQNVGGPSMAPPMHHGMDPMGPSTSATNAVATSTPPVSNTSLFGDIPEHKRRPYARDSRFVSEVQLGLPPVLHLESGRAGQQWNRDPHSSGSSYAGRH